MPRSIIDTYAISLRPDQAMLAAMGKIRILIHREPLDYRGRLLFYACNYADRDDETEGFRILVEQGWSPEEAPTQSVLGYADLVEVRHYDPNSFMLDAPFHAQGDSMYQFLAESNWAGLEIYGHVLRHPFLLTPPLCGVPGESSHGVFWTPQTPLEMLSFKTALEPSRGAIDIEAVRAQYSD